MPLARYESLAAEYEKLPRGAVCANAAGATEKEPSESALAKKAARHRLREENMGEKRLVFAAPSLSRAAFGRLGTREIRKERRYETAANEVVGLRRRFTKRKLRGFRSNKPVGEGRLLRWLRFHTAPI